MYFLYLHLTTAGKLYIPPYIYPRQRKHYGNHEKQVILFSSRYFQNSSEFEMAFSSSPHHLGNPSTNFTKNKHGKMTIPSKDLDIVWGGDDRYWTIPNGENSAAHLHQVSWLEVTASVRGTNPSKNYDVGFRVSVTPDAFGWSNYPVYIMVKRGKEGKFAWNKVFLNTNETNKPFEITGRLIKPEKPLEDSSDDQRVYFGLYEVWSGKWKGGLKIHHAFITESP